MYNTHVSCISAFSAYPMTSLRKRVHYRVFLFLQMMGLYKDPEGKDVFMEERAGSAGGTHNTLPYLTTGSGTDREIEKLRKRIAELEEKIAREKVSLATAFSVLFREDISVQDGL